jgi:hypothetical protein
MSAGQANITVDAHRGLSPQIEACTARRPFGADSNV